MIIAPDSFLLPNDVIYASPSLPPSFLSKYSFAVPDVIASLASSNDPTPLDAAYQPGCYDVVCGRGKGSYNRPGNKRFRALVATFIGDYHKSRTKVDKTAVLNGIVETVRSHFNPDTGRPVQFVKYCKSTGWVQIGDDLAREKVGHAMREAVMAQATRAAEQDQRSFAVQYPGQTLLSHGEIPGGEQ
jgi:hypothetical protein